MNTHNTVSLLIEGLQTIKVTFEPNREGDYRNSKQYTYKTLEQGIKKGDYFIVWSPISNGPAIVRVEHVDAFPDIDPQGSYSIGWAIQRIDLETWEARKKHEGELAGQLNTIQTRRIREQVLNELRTGSMGDNALENFQAKVNVMLGNAVPTQLGENASDE